MLGWALDSLRHRIRKAEREWRAANPIGRGYAYNPVRRWFVMQSAYPARWAFWYTLALVLMSAVICLWYRDMYPGWTGLARLSRPFTTSTSTLSARLAYFTAVWTIQATLAGLVYPIVIGFVTILLQRRYNGKAVLHIYLADSAAIVSGLSALALIGVMGIQYLAIPLAPLAIAPLWTLLDGVALVVNLVFTAAFLHQTFEFIRPDRRTAIIGRYAVSVIWPQELREYRARHIVTKFVDVPSTNSQVVVTTNRAALLHRGSIVATTTFIRKPSTVSDVRFRLLGWAVASWQRRALRQQPHSGGEASFEGALANRPVLVLPLAPGESDPNQGSVILCQTDSWCELSDRAKWLVKHAFIFEPVQNTRSSLRISDILGEIQAEVMLAIQANEIQTFTDRLSEWGDLYCQLIKTAPFRNPAVTGELDQSGGMDFSSDPVQLFWKSRVGVAATTAFEGLADAAVAKLDTNTEFVLVLIRILGELHRRLRESLHPGAFLDYSGLLSIVFARVQVWWVTAAEQNGDVEHTPCHGVLLRPPFSGTYRLILRTFAEEWGRWEKDIIPAEAKDSSVRQSGRPWSVLQNGAEYLHAHMRETLMLFFGCVQRGDKEGAQRFLDVLLTWRAQIEPHNIRSIVDGLPRRNWLTLEVAACTWEEAKNNWAALWDPGWQQMDKGSASEPRASEAIFWAALRNYWIDACYIAMLGLVAVGKECLCETSLAVHLLRALVFEQMPGIVRNARNERPLHDSREWLFSLLRFYEAYGTSGKPQRPQYYYLFQLRGKLREIVGLNDEFRIAGRMPIGLPVFTEVMRVDAVLAVWLLLADAESAAIMPDDAQRLEEWVHADLYRAEVFVNDLTQMQERLESAEFKSGYQGIAECAASLAKDGGFDERVTVRSRALREIVDKLGAIARSTINQTPISEACVREVSQDCSGSDIFTRGTRHFPVRLFRSIGEMERQEAEGTESQFWELSMPRAAFIESHMGNSSAPGDRVRMRLRFEKEVASAIVHAVMTRLNPGKIWVETPQEWWTQVDVFSEDCKKRRLQPLCVLAGPTLPDWLLHWAQPGARKLVDKPHDLRLWCDDGNDKGWSQIDGYVGHLNNVPAFYCLSPVSQSYLLVREALDRVTFAPWEDGYFVQASVNLDQNDSMRVVLRLSWRVKVEVEARPALRLRYDW